MSALEYLILRNNSLTELPSKGDLFAGLPALREINLSKNALESLPSDVFSGLTALESLGLGDNPSLGTGLPETVFSGLTALAATLSERHRPRHDFPRAVLRAVGTDEHQTSTATGS